MGKRAVAIRHVAFEHLGGIRPVLERHGYEIETIDVGADPLDEAVVLTADLVVVLGGPVGVYDDGTYPVLATERALLAARLAAGGPTIGICLGAQLMAAALGAAVYPGGTTEIGFVDDVSVTGVLAPLEGVRLLQWHGDTFDLPEGAVRLASSGIYPNQAFGVGSFALALQFHPEVDAGQLEQFLIGHALELSNHGIDVAALRTEGAIAAPAQVAALQRVLDDFIAGLPDAAAAPATEAIVIRATD